MKAGKGGNFKVLWPGEGGAAVKQVVFEWIREGQGSLCGDDMAMYPTSTEAAWLHGKAPWKQRPSNMNHLLIRPIGRRQLFVTEL